MKKLFLITIIFVINLSLFCQENYITYYHLKNKAEVYICSQNYIQALQYYEEAFKTVEYPLVQELYNATLCAAIAGNKVMYKYLQICLERGVNFSLFKKNNKVFEKYKNNPEWQSLACNKDKAFKKYQNSLNQSYKYKLDSLEKADTKARNKISWVNRLFKNSAITKKKSQDIHITDSCNHIELIKLYKLYGYPCEKNIGINAKTLPLRTYYYVILHHFRDTSFYNIQRKAVIEGKMKPFDYAQKMDYINFFTPQYYFYREGYPKDKETETVINNNRYAIGFPTFEEMETIRKYITETKNPYHFYFDVIFRKR